MRPGAFTAETEIVSIGAVAVLALVFFNDAKWNAMTFAVSDCGFFCFKFELDLLLHVSGTAITHDIFKCFWAFWFKLKTPELAVTHARLHGIFARAVYACDHGFIPVAIVGQFPQDRLLRWL